MQFYSLFSNFCNAKNFRKKKKIATFWSNFRQFHQMFDRYSNHQYITHIFRHFKLKTGFSSICQNYTISRSKYFNFWIFHIFSGKMSSSALLAADHSPAFCVLRFGRGPLTSTALVKARARMRDILGPEGAPRVVDPLMTKHGDPGGDGGEFCRPTSTLIPVQQI